MPLNAVQRRTIDAIVQIFETGKYTPNSYGAIADVKADTGGISYGLHQASVTSGNLYLLLKRYVEAKGQFAKEFEPFMATARAKDRKLGQSKSFKDLLTRAGSDPIMQMTQDDFFYDQFMKPAVAAGEKYGFVEPLSYAVIYDSYIHGSWAKIRDRTNDVARASEERKWLAAYVKTRRAWLSNASALLARTVYRSDTFLALIKSGNWALALPLVCHGIKLTAQLLQFNTLDLVAPSIEDTDLAKAEESPVLMRDTDPKKPGNPKDAVIALQNALLKKGFYKFKADGLFGQRTEDAVEAFQRANGLKPDGIVGNNTKEALDLD